MPVDTLDFLLRVGLATVFGLMIGLDRQVKRKPLGAQAYMLIASGSAAMMIVAMNYGASAMAENEAIGVDPTRVIQGVLGGIGFLGAGAIISQNESGRLRGVASGAAVWTAGGIGIASGLGYLIEAGFLAALTFATLAGFEWVQDRDMLPDEKDD